MKSDGHGWERRATNAREHGSHGSEAAIAIGEIPDPSVSTSFVKKIRVNSWPDFHLLPGLTFIRGASSFFFAPSR
jgi:hypothetical protein